jgi:hypothetical protein
MEEMTKQKLGEYLLFFAKFDYVLVRSGFIKSRGRKIQEDIHTAEAEWDAFIEKLPSDFYKKINQEIDLSEMINHPPESFGKSGDDAPQFYSESPITDTKSLIYACKHVRNNLIHGEKLQKDYDNVQRNYGLLDAAKQVLLKAMDDISEMRRVFNDIPY